MNMHAYVDALHLQDTFREVGLIEKQRNHCIFFQKANKRSADINAYFPPFWGIKLFVVKCLSWLATWILRLSYNTWTDNDRKSYIILMPLFYYSFPSEKYLVWNGMDWQSQDWVDFCKLSAWYFTYLNLISLTSVSPSTFLICQIVSGIHLPL